MERWNVNLPPAVWITRDTPRELERLVTEVEDRKALAIDTETTGKENYMQDSALFWSLSWGDNRVVMPVDTLSCFKRAFADQSKQWVFCNAKFDMHCLYNVGTVIAGHCLDTSVMHALMYEERPHSLDYMEKDRLGWTHKKGGFKVQVDLQKVRDAYGKLKWEPAKDALLRMEQNNRQKLVEYAGSDAYGTYKVYESLKKELQDPNRSFAWSIWPNDYATLWDVFWQNEVPFTKVLWDAERNGIQINRQYLESLERPMLRDIEQMAREMAQLAAKEAPELFGHRIFRPSADADVRDYYFSEQGQNRRPRKLTKGGKTGNKMASVDKEVVAAFDEDGDQMAALLAPYNKLCTFYSAYIKPTGLLSHLDNHGRGHTHYNQGHARTSRLSSSKANFQNVKKVDEDQYKVRSAFEAPPGKVLLIYDYDQLEMRILASAANEPKMINIFRQNRDVHVANAELIFGGRHSFTYEDVVAAKKKDKSGGKLTAAERTILGFRQRTKTVGYG